MDAASGAADYVAIPIIRKGEETKGQKGIGEVVERLRSEMLLAAESLEFEKAAQLRDQLARLGHATMDKTDRKRPTLPTRKRRSRS